MVSSEHPKKSVESPVYQQDTYSGVGGSKGKVKSLCDLYGETRDCEVGEELPNENIISKQDDSLGEGGVIMIKGRVDDLLVEDQISEDIDQKDFSLYEREVEEVERNFVGRGVEDGEHSKDGRIMLGLNTLYPY